MLISQGKIFTGNIEAERSMSRRKEHTCLSISGGWVEKVKKK